MSFIIRNGDSCKKKKCPFLHKSKLTVQLPPVEAPRAPPPPHPARISFLFTQRSASDTAPPQGGARRTDLESDVYKTDEPYASPKSL